MWKFGELIAFASVILLKAGAQGEAEGIPFPGHLPGENVRALAPDGDGRPNDIYAHIPVRGPELHDDQIVVYPHNFLGSEYGQDPEHKVYQVRSATNQGSLKHDKHGKKHKAHGQHHEHHDHHHEHAPMEIKDTKGKSFQEATPSKSSPSPINNLPLIPAQPVASFPLPPLQDTPFEASHHDGYPYPAPPAEVALSFPPPPPPPYPYRHASNPPHPHFG